MTRFDCAQCIRLPFLSVLTILKCVRLLLVYTYFLQCTQSRILTITVQKCDAPFRDLCTRNYVLTWNIKGLETIGNRISEYALTNSFTASVLTRMPMCSSMSVSAQNRCSFMLLVVPFRIHQNSLTFILTSYHICKHSVMLVLKFAPTQWHTYTLAKYQQTLHRLKHTLLQ